MNIFLVRKKISAGTKDRKRESNKERGEMAMILKSFASGKLLSDVNFISTSKNPNVFLGI
jgi:hypothetical protein